MWPWECRKSTHGNRIKPSTLELWGGSANHCVRLRQGRCSPWQQTSETPKSNSKGRVCGILLPRPSLPSLFVLLVYIWMCMYLSSFNSSAVFPQHWWWGGSFSFLPPFQLGNMLHSSLQVNAVSKPGLEFPVSVWTRSHNHRTCVLLLERVERISAHFSFSEEVGFYLCLLSGTIWSHIKLLGPRCHLL